MVPLLRQEAVMDHPARLPIDCPRCENRGHIDFGDDDVRLPCPLCNNWCMLCVQQSLLRGSFPDGERFTVIVRATKAIRIERSRAF